MTEQFFLGYPIEFKKTCLIYPPKIKDIVINNNYPVFVKILTMSQEEIEDEYIKQNWDLKNLLTPFEFLLNNAFHNKEIEKLTKEAFTFFVHEPVILIPKEKIIVIGDIKNIKDISSLRLLKEEDFFDFQNLIRESIGEKQIEPPRADEDPRVKAIKAKARYRDKIKLKSGKGIKLITSLASICCMKMGLNPLNIGELSYAAIPLLMSTYQEQEKYTIDIDSLLAGADSKKIKLEYWIRNLED